MLKQVEIFTDGSCLVIQTAATALSCATASTKTFSAGYRLTTNNRMELMAAIVARSVKRALRSGAQH